MARRSRQRLKATARFSIDLELVRRPGGGAAPRAFLVAFARRLATEIALHVPASRLKKRGSALTVVFMSEAEARELNNRYRSRDYATDVLSFSADAGFSGDMLGELVLCLPVIARQAKEHGLSRNDELSYMILHGVLHLLGYDHEASKAAEKTMFRIQEQIWAELARG